MNKKILVLFLGILLVGTLGFVTALWSFNESTSSGLVGHWTLDGADYNSVSNRVTDKSAYENHGTNNGAILASDRMENNDSSMDFGTRSNSYYINAGNDDSLQITGSQTISLWLKPTNTSEGRQNPYNKAYGGEGTITQEPTGIVNYYWGTAGANAGPYQGFTMTSNIQNGEWVHLAIVRDLENMELRWYKNGVLTNQVNAAYSQANASSGDLWIGRGYAGPYSGSIDEVRLYNRALSENEIESLYNSYKPKISGGPLKKGLVLDLPLTLTYTKSEVVGSEIMTDRTPYSNDAENHGAIIGSDGASFDGVNDYMALDKYYESGDSLPAFTVAIWYNTSFSGAALNDNWALIDFDRSEWFDVYIRGDNGRFAFSGSDQVNGYFDIYAETASNDGKWHQGVVVYDSVGDTITFYLDGVQDGKLSYVDVAPISDTITRYGLIGDGSEATSYDGSRNSIYYEGHIQGIKMYNRALSENEIESLYAKGRYA